MEPGDGVFEAGRELRCGLLIAVESISSPRINQVKALLSAAEGALPTKDSELSLIAARILEATSSERRIKSCA